MQRPLEALVRKVNCMVFNPVKKGRGRPRRTLEEINRRYFMLANILENWFLTKSNDM